MKREMIENPEFGQTPADPLPADKSLIFNLKNIHSALDRGLGDTDVSHKTVEELYDDHPIQWAAERLAELIQKLETR